MDRAGGDPPDVVAPQIRFGLESAIDGDRLVAAGGTDDRTGSGVAYVYKRTGTTWTLETRLYPGFGRESVAYPVRIRGDTVLVGSTSVAGVGAVYVFGKTPAGWFQSMVVPADGAMDDGYGWGTALDDATIAVGSYWHRDRGAVYTYGVRGP